MDQQSDLLKKCIRLLRIKHLITSHDSDEVFSIRQIDDVMRPSRNHIDGFNLFTTDFKLHRLSSVNISLLDQAMTMHNNKLLPLAVVPVLTLCNTRFISLFTECSLGRVDAPITEHAPQSSK